MVSRSLLGFLGGYGFLCEKNIHLCKIKNVSIRGVLARKYLQGIGGISINENADPTVLADMNQWFDRNIKENEPYYRHIYEGADDMPAHIKTVLTGFEITLPITNYQLNLGTWQGIYLGEFRNHGGNRKIIVTIYY